MQTILYCIHPAQCMQQYYLSIHSAQCMQSILYAQMQTILDLPYDYMQEFIKIIAKAP